MRVDSPTNYCSLFDSWQIRSYSAYCLERPQQHRAQPFIPSALASPTSEVQDIFLVIMAKHKIRFWLRGGSTKGHANGREKEPAPSQTTIGSAASSLKKKKGSRQEQTTENDIAQQPNMSRMVQLSEKIRTETEKLDAYITATGLPQPSFDVDGPEDFPKLPQELQKARQEVIFATEELRTLALGPRQSVRWGVWNVRSSRTSLPGPKSNQIPVPRHAKH